MSAGPADTFSFKLGDLVLVKWLDNMVYFAKIKRIDQRRKKCVVVFDDKSHDEADFDQIHSGKCLYRLSGFWEYSACSLIGDVCTCAWTYSKTAANAS